MGDRHSELLCVQRLHCLSWSGFLSVAPFSSSGFLGFWDISHAESHEAVFGEMAGHPRLIDSGAYSWVRHPMYLGTLLFCLGFFLAMASLLSLGIWIVFFVFYDRMATYEEGVLVGILGEEYGAYQRRVPKWYPGLQRRED